MTRLRLEQLPVRYQRSQVGLSGPVRGGRAAFGSRGIYVAFDAHGLQYVAQGGAMPTRSALPGYVIASEIALRTNRFDLFKAYLRTADIVLFLLSLVDSTLLCALMIAGVLVHGWNKRRGTTCLLMTIDCNEIGVRLALCHLPGARVNLLYGRSGQPGAATRCPLMT